MKRWLNRVPLRSAGFVALVAIIAVGMNLASSPKAYSWPFTSGEHIGFFEGRTDLNGGSVIQEGLNAGHSATYNINNLVSDVTNALNRTGTKFVAPQDALGAAFIVLTMLGYREGTINDSSLGISTARTQLARWTTLVRSYATAGRVNFNTNFTYTKNTYWMTGSTGYDVAWYTPAGGAQTDRAIVFNLPGGTQYAIKHACGNPVGDMPTLPPLGNFSMTGRVTARTAIETKTSGPAGGINTYVRVNAGKVVTYSYVLQNLGTTASPAITYSTMGLNNGAAIPVVTGPAGTFTANQSKTVRTENFTVPAGAAIGTQYCRRVLFTPTSSTDATQSSSGLICAVVVAPVVSAPDCGGLTPTSGEVGDTLDLVGNVTFTAASPPAPPTYVMTFKLEKLDNAGVPVAPALINIASIAYTSTTSGAENNSGTANYTFTSSGTYRVSWDFNSGAGAPVPLNSPVCREEVTIVQKPYFKVYNGDVQAGAVFAPCDSGGTPVAGEIKAFAKQTGGNYVGSSVQVAALAFEAIDQFTSASHRASAPVGPDGLSFANTGGGTYGGNYGTGSCIPDFWGLTSVTGSPGINVGNSIYPNGAAKTVALSEKTDIFVEGNVMIDNNIIYANGWTLNATTNDIPSFRLIVHGGNIYIKNTVTQLDGIYIALPKDTGEEGMIFTCSVTDYQPATPLEISNNCQTQLDINGAFIARQVKLMRTSGSLSDSVAGEAMATSKAAEVFNYSPVVWMAVPRTVQPVNGSYDSIISLPPVL